MSGDPLSTLFGGGGSQQQSRAGPVNLNPSAFTGLAPGVASALSGYFNQQNPFAFTGGATPSLTPGAYGAIQGVTNFANQGGGFNLNPYLSSTLDPNFLNTSQNPMVQGAVTGAVNPIISAYQQTTVPGLIGASTAAGQSSGPQFGKAQSPEGSSAFDYASAVAQRNLEQSVGATSSAIELGAQDAARQQQAGAASTVPSYTTSMLNTLVQSVQSQLLPTMMQEFGIEKGLGAFQSVMQTVLQALQTGVGAAKPAIGQQSTSSGSSYYTPGLFGGAGDLIDTGTQVAGWF